MLNRQKHYEIRKEKGVNPESNEAIAFPNNLHLLHIGMIERGEVSTSISLHCIFIC